MDARPIMGALLAGLVIAVAAPALASSSGDLPPGTQRGPASELRQYPSRALATPRQRTAARALLSEMRQAARKWRSPRVAKAAGFRMIRAARTRANRSAVLYFHSEHRGYSNDRFYLRPQRPETLIYADIAGRPLVLIGVMFAVPRRVHGPTPGGPITRWHTHQVCMRGTLRGVTPRPNGSCPRGARKRQGSEMLHLWFTRDLRSAFAIHAPEPELCVAGLLPPGRCTHAGHHGMS
jgi:hypothetical protein